MNNKQIIIDSAKKLIELTDIPVYIELMINVKYRQSDRELQWISEGDEYGIDYISCHQEQDGLFIANGDNGCGETITYIFDLDNKLTEEQWEELLEELE